MTLLFSEKVHTQRGSEEATLAFVEIKIATKGGGSFVAIEVLIWLGGLARK